ncbi:tudor domain-containing protein 7 isoform X2 [Rhineura floridana]|uniref:tudor domain-containing protein 7 isoform X2 n=1 Tax=Rhineura floridana TaxID=261503 RepID=UPI002AC81604|nr:tudor domain-containing protein 7 isoform X2 [Rhineura floridana]
MMAGMRTARTAFRLTGEVKMQEADLVAKMLRAVLQTHKNGVPFSRLQGEYKSLTGDWIPFKQLGHPTLEGYIKSIPGVVRIEIGKTGEVTCHAVICQETARIAQLVARQRTSNKKSGRQVNCSMRLKKIVPLASVGKPKGTLRKTGFMNFTEETSRSTLPLLRSKGSCTVVRPSMSTAPYPLSPEFGNPMPKEVLNQGHLAVMNSPERRPTLPPRFQKELKVHLSKSVPVDINENAKETKQLVPLHPPCQSNTDIYEIQRRIKEILNRYSNGICLSKIPHVYREAYQEDLNTALLPQCEYWPHICVTEKVCCGGLRDVFLYPAAKTHPLVKDVPSQGGSLQSPLVRQTAEVKAEIKAEVKEATKAAALQEDFKQKIAAILLKYSNGLWANALPKVYEDMYKAPLPKDILNSLDCLSDICSVDYISDNPKKAILYAKSKRLTDENQNVTGKIRIHEELRQPTEQQPTVIKQESQEEYLENITVPPLIIPAETSPSVLVVELSSTNEVVVRYVGKDYSAAQESMEDEMKDWFCQNPSVLQMQSPKVGQVVAVPAVEDAWLRAQIISTEGDRTKVCYVDYGFSEIIENTRVYKLAKHFFSLPFQASKCRLAGLEAFCDDPAMVKTVESQTCGKIFAVEILEKSEIPLVVLYDTSGEDDININATCLKTLLDKSLELHLQVDTLYRNVQVTNVCSDGTLYCQVPSNGMTKLSEVLQKLENYFHHKVTEYSVSLPYCGMICLFNCKGKWARVEITSVHSSRALDVQFMDTGTVASVKVVELREIPPTFLREIIVIPAQATKCCLADLPLNIGMWTPDAVLWLRDTVLNCPDCSIKVVKLDDRIAHIYLFTPKNFLDPDRSINRQITNADLWKHQKDVFLSAFPSSSLPAMGETDLPETACSGVRRAIVDSLPHASEPSSAATALNMPPPLLLAQPQEQMDVYVSLACHPGYFVLQAWQEMHSLEVLMEDMLLYYSTADEGTTAVEKNKLYAAKVKNKWHRVLIKGMLANGLVSVYELDYGKHELVGIQNVRPLLDMFRKLPFQAITAQLAGTVSQQWSEEASVVFRNHVEKKPLVAQMQTVIDGANPWDRKVVVYLVDTSQPDTDIWIHDIMTQYCMEISKAN